MNFEKEVAQSLLKIDAIGFKTKQPVTFKSGIKSPVYTDCRRFPFYPKEWKQVIAGFKQLLEKDGISFDIIAGAELAGIPHSAALGFFLEKPSVMVRKKPKEHGLGKLVEGGEVTNKKALMLEDLVSTGGTCLTMIEALRREGAMVQNCAIIITYGFKESVEAFKNAGVRLHALTNFPIVLEQAISMGKLNEEEKELVEDWLLEPHSWATRHNF